MRDTVKHSPTHVSKATACIVNRSTGGPDQLTRTHNRRDLCLSTSPAVMKYPPLISLHPPQLPHHLHQIFLDEWPTPTRSIIKKNKTRRGRRRTRTQTSIGTTAAVEPQESEEENAVINISKTPLTPDCQYVVKRTLFSPPPFTQISLIPRWIFLDSTAASI